MFFVGYIARMDVLFEASFSPLSSSGEGGGGRREGAGVLWGEVYRGGGPDGQLHRPINSSMRGAGRGTKEREELGGRGAAFCQLLAE
jgi:hypothetical protein